MLRFLLPCFFLGFDCDDLMVDDDVTRAHVCIISWICPQDNVGLGKKGDDHRMSALQPNLAQIWVDQVQPCIDGHCPSIIIILIFNENL